LFLLSFLIVLATVASSYCSARPSSPPLRQEGNINHEDARDMLNISKFRKKSPVKPREVEGTTGWDFLSSSLRKICRLKSVFLWVVLVPNLASVLYFGLLESTIYISESKCIIRQADKKSQTGLSALLESAGITTSKEEVYTLQEYVQSRDVVKILDENLGLRKVYASKHIDLFNRFNPFGLDDSFEAFYEYYQRIIVAVDINTSSSIVTIKVKGFTSKIAHAINSALIFLGEGFVNELNERARQDLISFSTQEVETAEKAAKEASLALSDYRNRQTLFDPSQQSTMQLQQISKLQTDLVDVRGQLAQLRTFTSENPYVKALEKRRNELQNEINIAMSKVAGGSNSMVQKMTDFERLSIDREFLEKRLVLSLSALQQARSEAQHQRLYLAKIAMPSLPDSTRYPERGFNILLTFCGTLLAYGCLRMLMIGTEEHRA
jgi:capsular polysaccharide transport system permease protein